MATSKASEMDFFEKVGYVFSIIKPSWEAFKLNWSTFVILWVLPVLLILLLIPLFILPALSDSTAWSAATGLLAFIGVLLAIFVALLLWPAMTYTQLASVKQQKVAVDQALKESKDVILQFILAGLLFVLIVVTPLLVSIMLTIVLIGLLLLPFAIAWAIVAPFFLILVPFLIINKRIGAIDAIKNSFELAKKYWQWVLAVYVVLFALNIGVNLVSWIPILGFVVAVGVGVAYFCMPAYVYVNHIDAAEEGAKSKESAKASKSKSIKKSPSKKS